MLKMFETIGSHSAQMLTGAILSCGAGPEIYATYSGFPGLWVHGEPRQGKSSVSRWGMAIFGQHVDKGMPLEDSTKAGLGIALQQYGNLLVWLEEYQPTAPKWMIEKIKNIYGRESGTKKTFDEGDREILASAIVTGVATSMDAQLRSRYVHVQVASKNRRGEHYGWFEANRKKFCLIGRYIMRNRKRFAALTLSRMETWLNLPEMKGADARARIVHGSAFAALGALAEMLQVTSLLQDQEGFQHFLVREVTSSVKEVDEQVNVNQFWRYLLDALASDAFGKTPKERRGVFKAEKKPTPVGLISPKQLEYEAEQPFCKYQSYYLYFMPGPVIEMLRAHLRKQGREYPLEQPDLRSQMKTRPYFVPPKKDYHRQKFANKKTSAGCWCINVDFHPEGFVSVTDDEFFRSFKKNGDMNELNLPSEEWIDPRKGDLFELIELLESSRDNSDES